uniref:ubiquitinyl hydrolase 1 n=1 Tax=Amblyomma aureolatum TaxID=187763 RepID=A0A1E1X4N7_9ACAR
MDLSVPSTSSSGATSCSSSLACKAPPTAATASLAALTECVQLRPLFCSSLSPEAEERGGELPEEEEVGGGSGVVPPDGMGLPEEEVWPATAQDGPFSLFSSLQDPPPLLLLAHDAASQGGGGPEEEDEDSPLLVRGVCGLRNLGNTCFMNAGLQCLLSHGNLVAHLLREEEGRRPLLTQQLAQLLRQAWSGRHTCLRPAPFREALVRACPQFGDCRQHDCQEFLTLLLDTLHEQTNQASRHSDSSSPQGSSSDSVSAICGGGQEPSTSTGGSSSGVVGQLAEEVQPCRQSKYSEAEESAVVGEEQVQPRSPAAPSTAKRRRLRTHSTEVSTRQPAAKRLRPDLEMKSNAAQLAWDQYVAHNRSVVVDIFQGQFRSTVVCSECGHVSVTYEPFMYLPVPLPHALERHIEVTYVPLCVASGVRRCLVRLPKQETVGRLVDALLAQLEKGEPSPHGIALAEMSNNGHIFHRVLDEGMSVRCVGEGGREVFAFALGPHEEVEEDSEEEGACPLPAAPRAWHSCAICLEDVADDQLHVHPSCQCLLCRSCLEISCKHYGSDSLVCPQCNLPVKADGEFVPLSRMSSRRHRSRLVTVPLVFCQEGGQPWRLPALLRVPCHCHTSRLYAAAAAHLSPGACYTLALVDASSRQCSRCAPGLCCGGCEVARAGWVSLQPGDCLALRHPPDEALPPAEAWPAPSPPRAPLSLHDCLQAFSESETLDEQNPWFCPVCRRSQRARKSLSIWRPPDTLMVYLKRFVFHELLGGSKVDERVEFPLEGLDLGPFVSGPCPSLLLYDLHAYICHTGGVNCGHYTAYTRHWTTGEWYHYNDESVCKQPPKDQAQAYILFYQRRTTAASSGHQVKRVKHRIHVRGGVVRDEVVACWQRRSGEAGDGSQQHTDPKLRNEEERISRPHP